MPRMIKVLAVGVILLTLVVGLFAFSGKDEKTFAKERLQLERVLTESKGGENPFDEWYYSNTVPATKVRKLTAPGLKGKPCDLWVKNHHFIFAGGGMRLVSDNRLRGKHLSVVVRESSLNKILAYSSRRNPFIAGGIGAKAVAAYYRRTSPYQRLRDIYHARVRDIDAPGLRMRQRYLALYLFSLKAQLLPDCARYGFEEFSAPAGKGFIAGDVSKGKKLAQVNLYHAPSRLFFALVFKAEDGANSKVVYDLLARLRLAREGE